MSRSGLVLRVLRPGALPATLLAISAGAAAVDLAPLEARWERYMLEGVHGIYRPTPDELRACPERDNPRGAVLLAGLSKKCIVIQDLTETGFLGIGTGGGWGLEGGRLSEVEIEEASVELYVKIVWRYEPGIFDNHIDLEESFIEFFLVVHHLPTDERSMFRKWVRHPGSSLRRVTGQLIHRPDSQEIEVRVAEIANPIRDSISIEALRTEIASLVQKTPRKMTVRYPPLVAVSPTPRKSSHLRRVRTPATMSATPTASV